MSYIYHNETAGRDEVRENGNTIGHYYDNPLTGKIEICNNAGEAMAYRYDG